jgi:hypothetical protein
MYKTIELRVEAKPRPNPPPYVTLHQFKYILTHIVNKEQCVVRWQGGLCKGLTGGEVQGLNPMDSI